MDYADELKRIPQLAAIGEALASYAKTLIPGADFSKKKKSGVWACEPNFIAFKIQPDKRTIKFSIYGRRFPFERYSTLSLLPYRSSYLEFEIDTPYQLGPAVSYVGQAARAYALRKHDKDQLKRIEANLRPIKKTGTSD